MDYRTFIIPPSKVVTRTIADGPLPTLVAALTRTEYSVKICSPSNVTDVAVVTILEYSICDEVGLNSTLYQINPFLSLSGSVVQATSMAVGDTAVASRSVGATDGTLNRK